MWKWIFVVIILLGIGPFTELFNPNIKLNEDFETADRSSANLAPSPTNHKEAILQIYAARAFNWRGLFALHTWIAVKPKNASSYTVYQVIGWNLWRGLSAVSKRNDIPDCKWFNQMPWVVKDLRGEQAEIVITQLSPVIDAYPYKNKYHFWPGPNSNTFVAYVARNIPALHLAMPALAAGKDYLGPFTFFARAPSHTGYQFSLWGCLGILIAKQEGLEINLLGLTLGINPFKPSATFPGWGEFII